MHFVSNCKNAEESTLGLNFSFVHFTYKRIKFFSIVVLLYLNWWVENCEKTPKINKYKINVLGQTKVFKKGGMK